MEFSPLRVEYNVKRDEEQTVQVVGNFRARMNREGKGNFDGVDVSFFSHGCVLSHSLTRMVVEYGLCVPVRSAGGFRRLRRSCAMNKSQIGRDVSGRKN